MINDYLYESDSGSREQAVKRKRHSRVIFVARGAAPGKMAATKPAPQFRAQSE